MASFFQWINKHVSKTQSALNLMDLYGLTAAHYGVWKAKSFYSPSPFKSTKASPYAPVCWLLENPCMLDWAVQPNKQKAELRRHSGLWFLWETVCVSGACLPGFKNLKFSIGFLCAAQSVHIKLCVEVAEFKHVTHWLAACKGACWEQQRGNIEKHRWSSERHVVSFKLLFSLKTKI